MSFDGNIYFWYEYWYESDMRHVQSLLFPIDSVSFEWSTLSSRHIWARHPTIRHPHCTEQKAIQVQRTLGHKPQWSGPQLNKQISLEWWPLPQELKGSDMLFGLQERQVNMIFYTKSKALQYGVACDQMPSCVYLVTGSPTSTKPALQIIWTVVPT